MAPACSWTREAKAVSNSLSALAFRTGSRSPFAFPVSSTSRTTRSAFALCGFTSKAITPAWGTSSARSSSRLGINSIAKMLTPEVAAGPGETGDQAVLNRVAAGKEDDQDRRGRVFSPL